MKFCSQPHQAARSVVGVFIFLLATLFVNGQSASGRRRVVETSALNSQLTQQPQQSPSQSTVRVRVFYADNAQPLKSVRVVVMTADSHDPFTTLTNERGEFQLTGLRAGKYYVTIQGPGVPAPSGFGMTLPLPITAIPRAEDYPEIIPKHDVSFVVDGTNSADVEVRIVRGGSITGKVLKADGSPIPDVPVNLLSREDKNRPYTARFSGRTNQKGVYKIENVRPAEYVVSAAMEDKRGDIRARLRGEGQIVTFHPAAVRLAEALTVRVDSGRESGGVNITLVDRKLLSVSGTLVTGRDGSPIAGATVVLRGKDSEQTGPLVPGMGQRTTVTSSDGSWSFSNVTAGDYEVTALNQIGGGPVGLVTGMRMPPGQSGRPMLGNRGPSPNRARPRFSIVQEQISLVSADVENLTLTMRGTGRIRGVVETESGNPIPKNVTLFFEFSNIGSRPARPEPVQVASDGSFVIEDVPAGDRAIAAALQSGSDYYIASATMGGKDLRAGVTIVEDAEGGPVRIQLSTRFAKVSGRVLTSAGGQSPGTVVLFLPVEPWKQRFRTASIVIQPDADGAFVGKVPPGEYLLVARRRDQLPPLITADFVETLGRAVTRVVLLADEQKTIEVTF